MNVTEWLRGLGLEQYATAFRDNEIGERVLPSLTADDLKELGVNLIGHRRLLLDAIAALREAGPKQTASDLTAAPTLTRRQFRGSRTAPVDRDVLRYRRLDRAIDAVRPRGSA